ncbi:uncharacterized protein SCHCODRAFT_02699839 [Schizophyllum commune H4-8]|uniref:Uncharacterized protein n=1 Tax=Schizophyllum commune (strain H4-8 / FGSC 9210) TaxID=578458 RepID=D8PNC0_SCHCM|nr:uncharacterized protein SCHCODRAFT_02699839 [Schizophyllum commune H4-8]KAI5893141.1 hypothetical protein SCHCODRAFT_02699839 [Schizophyllum commune H4-8]
MPEEALLFNLVTTNFDRHGAIGVVGVRLLELGVQMHLCKTVPDATVEFMMTVKHALLDPVVHQAIMVKQGAYNGRVPRGSRQLAQEITRMFEAYIGVHCNAFGLVRSQTLVKDIYHLPMVAACEAVRVWEATTSVSLRGGFNSGAGSEHVPQPDATRAALSALYKTTLPDGCPELAQEFASTPEAHRPGRMALGMDALHAMTVLAITSFWEDIAPPQLWRIVSVILSQEFLHHIPHRLNPQLVRWPNKNDHLHVLFWFGCQALAGHEQAMRNFVYELIRPAILALRAFYFPLYLPNARIPFDWSNRIIVNPAMRHMLLRYVEGRSLGLYAGLMPDLRVKTVVEDAQRLLGTETQYITYDDTMGQIDNPSKILQETGNVYEPPVSPEFCLIVATVSGFPTRPTTEIETAIEQFLWLNFPHNLQAMILRFGAVNGELDGSVIMRIRHDCLYSIFEGNMVAGVHTIGRLSLQLDRDIRRGQCSGKLLNIVHRSIDAGTLAQRGLSAYRHLLLAPPGPLLPKAGVKIPMPMFSKEDLKVRSHGISGVGYVPDADCPVVDGCAVQFWAKGYLGSDPMALFGTDDRACLWPYAVRMDEGGWTCSILFNGLVSDTFLNNLNVVLPRLNGIEGEWVRMHPGAVQRWVAEVVQRKAQMHRFVVDCGKSGR